MARMEPNADFLILTPEETSFYELAGSLFSRSRDGNAEHRFVMFASLLLQKIVMFFRKPMALVGWVLEIILNTPSFNGGVFKLVLNIFWGKVMLPDNKSKKYVSFIGNLDSRVLLDPKINPGDNKYTPALAIMASKLAYENQAFINTIVTENWKMEFLGVYNFWNDYVKEKSTYAFMMLDKYSDPETYVISFRGTQPFNADEWRTDLDISWYEIPGVGNAHAGFMEALGMHATGWTNEIEDTAQHPVAHYILKKKLRDLLEKNSKAKFMLTGHSLGGALAISFASILAINKEDWLLERLAGIYTFGQPRVGNKRFGDFVSKEFKKFGVKYVRYVYCNDMVTRFPLDDSSFYSHFGTCLFFDSFYHGKVCVDAPNRNYFFFLAYVPMWVNAIWEILRGFLIGLVLGRDYREGWVQRCFRFCGLLIPGLPDHSIQDYVNSTRLGWDCPPPFDSP